MEEMPPVPSSLRKGQHLKPGGRRYTPEGTIIRFATLLGTFSLSETLSNEHLGPNSGVSSDQQCGNGSGSESSRFASDGSSAKTVVPCNGALASFLIDGPFSSSFPSLSLESGNHHHRHNESKVKVEAHAATNLSRPIIVVSNPEQTDTREITDSSVGLVGDTAILDMGAARGENTDTTFHQSQLSHEKHFSEENADVKEEQPGSVPTGKKSDWDAILSNEVFLADTVADVPRIMLRNLSSSFFLLIDARLRAYGTILSRHAASMLESSVRDEDLEDEEEDEEAGERKPEEQDMELESEGGNADEDNTEDVGGCSGEGVDCVRSGEEDASSISSCMAVERKLCALLEIGENLKIDAAVTSFHINSMNDEGDVGVVSGLGVQKGMEVASMPLVFEAIMDISVPNLSPEIESNGRDKMTVSIRAPGTILGFFDEGSDHSRLKSVKVDIDTHALLSSMINRACVVVAKAMENVNAAATIRASASSIPMQIGATSDDTDGKGLVHKRRTVDAMPPPDPRVLSVCRSFTEESLCGKPPIVSPDLGSMAVRPTERSLAPMKLDHDDTRAPSAESCAAIVDWVMGEVDNELLCPRSKRTRM